MLVSLFFTSFLLTCAFVWAIRAWARHNLLDVPNERSSHQTPTPRGGGAGIVLVFVILFSVGLALTEGFSAKLYVFLLTSLAVSVVSLADDFYTLSNRIRFFVHILSALTVLLVSFSSFKDFSLATLMGFLTLLVAVFWVVGLTNAYNFMDGIDGIAALQGVSAGSLWTLHGYFSGELIFSLIGVLTVGGCLGFYVFNRQPATIFMGDVGSAFLGFVFSVTPFLTDSFKPHNFILAIVFIAPFVLDTAITLFRRIIRRENIFQAHRSHFYQLLVIRGLQHNYVSLGYALISTLCGLAALLTYKELLSR